MAYTTDDGETFYETAGEVLQHLSNRLNGLIGVLIAKEVIIPKELERAEVMISAIQDRQNARATAERLERIKALDPDLYARYQALTAEADQLLADAGKPKPTDVTPPTQPEADKP